MTYYQIAQKKPCLKLLRNYEENVIKRQIGNQIKIAYQSKGFTPDQIAMILNLSMNQLRLCEEGENDFTLPHLVRLAKLLSLNEFQLSLEKTVYF